MDLGIIWEKVLVSLTFSFYVQVWLRAIQGLVWCPASSYQPLENVPLVSNTPMEAGVQDPHPTEGTWFPDARPLSMGAVQCSVGTM